MGKGIGPSRNSARNEIFVIAAIVVAAWYCFAQLDVFEYVIEFIHEMETYELDEVVLGILLAGIGGTVYAFRKHRQLKRESAKLEQAEEEVVWMAQHDHLTGLPNRKFLHQLCEHPDFKSCAETGQSHAVLVLDLDGFKSINDLFGHAGGDDLLIQVGDRLNWLMAEQTVLRVGGDEFVIVLRNVDTAQAKSAAREVVKALNEPFQINGNQTEASASVGIAMMPDHAPTLEIARVNADVALYEAKHRSKGSFKMFTKQLGTAMSERSRIEQQLRGAIRDGQLSVHYQPYIDLQTKEIIGFEALARWEQSDGTFIPPSTFIDIAEKSGQILELSELLFRKACKDACNWPGNRTLSFNLSASQLRDRLMAKRVFRQLEQSGLSPERLELEVTESCFVHDHEAVIATLIDLKNAGVRIALDDFGTGYSSFSRLTKVEFDKIKIDQLFVQECNDSARMKKIVGAIFALSKSLDTTIVAEGIETHEQLQTMQQFGCDIGQGYLFGRPVPAEKALELLAADQIVISDSAG
jgi:diguanylate cyclase (GGDEF)-like protein